VNRVVSDSSNEGPTRVVVAEDEAIIRLDLVETLTEHGYDVVGDTGRGDAVVELVRELEPDVALLDIKMPGMDGIDATRAISADRRAAVVLLTAFNQPELIDRAAEAGAMAYLVKPYRRDELVPAVQLALARFRELRALEGHAGELEERLEVRKLVDRAKGRLIDEHAMKEAEAFSFLQQSAMSGRRRMADVAADVVDGRLSP